MEKLNFVINIIRTKKVFVVFAQPCRNLNKHAQILGHIIGVMMNAKQFVTNIVSIFGKCTHSSVSHGEETDYCVIAASGHLHYLS